jgi:hypothetical protein
MRENLPMNDYTELNIKKATQFRKDGVEELRSLVQKFAKLGPSKEDIPDKERVYPVPFEAEKWHKVRDRTEKNKKIARRSPWWDNLKAVKPEDELD